MVFYALIKQAGETEPRWYRLEAESWEAALEPQKKPGTAVLDLRRIEQGYPLRSHERPLAPSKLPWKKDN